MESNLLSHLENSIPKNVVTYQVSFYTVALEAWRRGLKVKFHNSKRGSPYPSAAHNYSISDGVNEYLFTTARGSNTTKKAIQQVVNKKTSYSIIKNAGVPIPEGHTFSFAESSIDEMLEYGTSIGFPLVAKPIDSGGGKGVFTHINSVDHLKECILNIKDDLNKEQVLIEKYFTGYDYRFFVIQDKVIGVTKSYPSYVVGDGEHTLKELVPIMNNKIKKNIATIRRDIVIDDDLISVLEEQNLSLDYIPKNAERVFLRRHGSHLGHRLNVDCTDEIDPKFKEFAIKAVNSIDGLPYASVDMIINEEENEGVINELNTRGEIMMHLYPMEGIARDIPKAIIDYYFPNTERKNEFLYFEFQPIKDLFVDGLADEIVIPPLPDGTLYHQNFTIVGEGLKNIYLKKIHKRAAGLNLIGSIHKIEENKISLFLIGTKQNIKKYKTYLNKSSTKNSIVNSIEEDTLQLHLSKHNISLELKDLFNKSSSINFKF